MPYRSTSRSQARNSSAEMLYISQTSSIGTYPPRTARMTVALRATVHRCVGRGSSGTRSSKSIGYCCMLGISRSKVLRKSCDLLEAFGLSIYLTNKVSGRLSIKQEPRLATGSGAPLWPTRRGDCRLIG